MNRKMTIATVLGLLLLVAFTAGGYYAYTELWPVYRIKKQVSNALKDPESARFADVFVSKKTGIGCGQVNAKNAMGGYVGLTDFLAMPDGEVMFPPPDRGDVGTTQERIQALSALIDWNKLMIKSCPEDQRSTPDEKK